MSVYTRIKAALERSTMRKLIPVETYDPKSKLFGMEQGSVGALWIGSPLSGMDAKTETQIRDALHTEFPHNTIVQIQRYASPNLDNMLGRYSSGKYRYLNSGENRLDKQQTEGLKKYIAQRKDFIRSGVHYPIIRGSETRIKQDILIISVVVPPSSNWSNRAEIDALSQKMSRFEVGLRGAGIQMERVGPSDYMRIMRAIIDPFGDAKIRYDESIEINEQLPSYDYHMQIDREGVTINNMHCRSLSVKTYPKRLRPGALLLMFGDTIGSMNQQVHNHYVASLNIMLLDPAKIMPKYQRKKQQAGHFGSPGLAKFNPMLNHRKRAFELMDQAIESGDNLCNIWFNIQVFGKDKKDSAAAEQNMRSMASGYGFEFASDKYIAGPIFQQNLPLCADAKQKDSILRYQMKGTSHAVKVMPVLGDWQGNAVTPMQVYITRRSSLMGMNNWECEGGYNMLIAAETGAGKSTFTQDYARNQLASGTKLVILDKGRSYQKMCELHDGAFYDFNKAGVYNLNPFQSIKMIEEELEGLVHLIGTMAAPNDGLNDLQKKSMGKIIITLFREKGGKMTVQDVAEQCLSQEDMRVHDIGVGLYPFTDEGHYGDWFNSGEPIEFNGQLTVVELEELKNKPDLMAVVLLVTMTQIQRSMYLRSITSSTDRIMAIIDESWDVLKMPGPAEFAELAARQARKYGGALVIITQSLEDPFSWKGGEGIMANISMKVCLAQKSDAIKRLQASNKLEVSEYEYTMMESVRTETGVYSEIFFTTSRGSGVGRLVVSRYDLLMYTTDPTEKAQLNALMQQGLGLDDAIKTIIAEEEGQREAG